MISVMKTTLSQKLIKITIISTNTSGNTFLKSRSSTLGVKGMPSPE